MKRLMREAQQLAKNPVREFLAYPLEGNLLEWHFTMRGPSDSPYSEGLYHGRVMVPNNYPFAPPDVVLITPNGRFELERKICLSISSYHPENWQSTWGIATVLTALRDFMLTPGNNGIGAVEYPSEVRQQLAQQSRSFKCPDCGQSVAEHLEVLDSAPAATAGSSDVPPTPTAKPADVSSRSPGGQPSPPSLSASATAATSAAEPSPCREGGVPEEEHAMGPEKSSMSIAPTNEHTSDPQPDTEGAQPTPDTTPREIAEAAEAAPPAPPPVEDGPPAVVEAAAPEPAAQPPEPRIAIRRRGTGVEVQLSAKFVDALLAIVTCVFLVMLLKKALLDAPRAETPTGATVRGLVSIVRSLVASDTARSGPLSDAEL